MDSKNTTPIDLSIEKYAQHRKKMGMVGGDRGSINMKISLGVLTLNENKKIVVKDADTVWPDMAKPKKKTPANPVVEKSSGIAGGYTPESFGDVRIDLERTKGRLAKLELEERTGELVSAREVELQSYATARDMRDNLNSMADRMAPILASESDPFKVESLLKREIAKTLENYVKNAKPIDISKTETQMEKKKSA